MPDTEWDLIGRGSGQDDESDSDVCEACGHTRAHHDNQHYCKKFQEIGDSDG